MIRLIALDLDNTLLEKNNQIHPRTLSLLRRCSENDIYVVIATGRLLLCAKIRKADRPPLQDNMLQRLPRNRI